ncbi:MAG: hypothetical protein NWE94_03240 [Candidatus Bathyarchaeota archaeon]|nr:hypothetical protein [Candidatus Bathyarchaeota archaeon]
MNERKLEFLVGDNPFHGISHLSQKRARSRTKEESLFDIERASKLVKFCLENGASGFTFSVSETTLSILETLCQDAQVDLYPVVPYAYEYVRIATKTGGFAGLATKMFKQIALSRDIRVVAPVLFCGLRIDPETFMKTYLMYELSRIRRASSPNGHLKCVILHEVVTDMALALNFRWLFLSYIKFMLKSNVRPGIHTRNLPFLVKKFEEWAIDTSELAILTPFNSIGFEMNPSRIECEKALQNLSRAQVIAMSILASGYLKPIEAIKYVAGIPQIKCIAVGVSSERQAVETFRLLNEQNGKC